jgi:pimeloyl-ACP methyl ester carboxylesterase
MQDGAPARLMRRARLAALLAAAALQPGCASLPGPGTATTSQGTFDYAVAGQGSPAVVLEAGLGDGKQTWKPVFAELARTTRVFAYDRAGYGASRSAAKDRSGRQVVAELHELLRAAGVAPPYVVVGHSLGGTYAIQFAQAYPGEVAGAVLIDARPADFGERCHAAEAFICEPPRALVSLIGGGAPGEYDAVPETMRQIRAGPPFPPVPLVVLTGMNKVLEGPTFNRLWRQTQQELAALSPRGRHVVCEHCGHYVHKDDPALAVAAIRDVISQARNGAGR